MAPEHASALLADRADHQQARLRPLSGRRPPLEQRQDDAEAGLGVERAPAPDAAILDAAVEGLLDHVLDAHRVGVHVEHDEPLGPAGDEAVDVGAPVRHLADLDPGAEALQPAGEGQRDGRAHRAPPPLAPRAPG